MDQKFVVLETNCYLKELMEASRQYSQEENTRQPGNADYVREYHGVLAETPLYPFTLESARKYIECLVYQQVQYRLAYNAQHFDTDIAMAQVLFGNALQRITPAHVAMSKLFAALDVVDRIYFELDRQIQAIIPAGCEGMWLEWEVVSHNGVIALYGGRDYRIVEWERMTGNTPDPASLVEVDLTPIMNHIRSRVTKAYGMIDINHQGMVKKIEAGRFLKNLRPIMADAIRRTWPRITFEGQVVGLFGEAAAIWDDLGDIDYDLLYVLGISDYEMFYKHFVKEAMGAFGMLHITNRLDETSHYRASISKENLLTIHYKDEPQSVSPQAKLEALAASYTNGDYLCEEDRRLAEAFIMERNR